MNVYLQQLQAQERARASEMAAEGQDLARQQAAAAALKEEIRAIFSVSIQPELLEAAEALEILGHRAQVELGESLVRRAGTHIMLRLSVAQRSFVLEFFARSPASVQARLLTVGSEDSFPSWEPCAGDLRSHARRLIARALERIS